jgi:hypothetical protein
MTAPLERPASIGRWWRERARWQRWLLPIAVAAITVPLLWAAKPNPDMSLDRNWLIGLQQAAQDGLRYGHDIVYTYGPLGFLAEGAPFLGFTSVLSFLATASAYAAAVVVILAAARRLFPLWVAVLVTVLFGRVLGVLGPFEALQLVAFGLALELLRRDRVPHSDLASIVAAAFAAVGLLGKINVGVFVATGAAVLIVCIWPNRLRGLLVFGAALGAWILGLWLVTGQQLADLVPYVRASYEIVSGYSDSMGVTHGDLWWVVGVFGLLGLLVCLAAYMTARDWPRPRQLALGLLLAILLFALWKHGFVRDHFGIPFATLAIVLLLVMPTGLGRPATAGALLLGLVAFVVGAQAPPEHYLDVVSSARNFTVMARDSLLPWRWDRAASLTQQRLQRTFDIPPEVIAAIQGRTVHIDPYAAAVASAYDGFTWRPQPVFQSFSAYTPYLDALNADLLRSDDRPEMILRWFQLRKSPAGPIVFAVDLRDYWFDAPAATLERLCRYREVLATKRWQVLADSGRSCGEPRPIATVSAARGEAVTVPAPPSANDFVIARVHGADDGLIGRLRATAWKAPEWYVTVDGKEYRLVQDTVRDGLLLAVPEEAQGSPPFAFGPPVQTISIREQGSNGGGALTYEFFAVPLQQP